jgi:phosphate starvation-inducible PhoH-like protein
LNAVRISQDLVLEPADNTRLANLCGQFDEHLRQIEKRLDIDIASRGNRFRITGQPGAAKLGSDVLRSLFKLTGRERIDPERVHICLQESVMRDSGDAGVAAEESESETGDIEIQTRRKH